MRSLGQNNFGARRKGGKLVSPPVAFALVAAVVLVLMQFFFPYFFPSLLSHLFSPLQSGKQSVLSSMTPGAQLAEENQTLQQEVALDDALASSSKALLDQNNELKSLLNRPGGANGYVFSNVLRRPPGAGYDYLIVDVGSSNGVSVGSPVYSEGSIPIGQVIEADPHSSKVELYSSGGESYDALVGASHVPVTAVGQGGGSFSASVSQQSGVSVGDEVIVPAISSSPFGIVSAVISDPAQPFERVFFSDSVNPYQLLSVIVNIDRSLAKPFAGSMASTTVSTLTASTSSSKKH